MAPRMMASTIQATRRIQKPAYLIGTPAIGIRQLSAKRAAGRVKRAAALAGLAPVARTVAGSGRSMAAGGALAVGAELSYAFKRLPQRMQRTIMSPPGRPYGSLPFLSASHAFSAMSSHLYDGSRATQSAQSWAKPVWRRKSTASNLTASDTPAWN